MIKLTKSQRNQTDNHLHLQLPPTLTQTSIMEDSNINSSMASPNIRKLKKKQSINSKFSKFDLHDRSQFGQALFQQIQNQQDFKQNGFNKKTVRFSPSLCKENDQSFLKNMPLFKQFEDDHNFSQIQCSQIPKKQNYQCEFQQIVSPRKLKRQTSVHQNNQLKDHQKDLRVSGRKNSFQIISQQSNSGSHNSQGSSISQSKKFNNKKLFQSKNIYKTPNLQVIHQFNNKKDGVRSKIQENSFENSKFEQSNIESELQHLKDNHTIEIEDVLSQNQEQIQQNQQNQFKKQNIQSNLSQSKNFDISNKIKLNSLNQEKNQTSSSGSSLPSPKLLSFGQIQTPKFPKDKQLVSRLKNTCERVLNMNKASRQATKQNDKNSMNFDQNQNKSGFSLKVIKVQNNLSQFNKKNLSTVEEGHENQSHYYDQKTFVLADDLKINASSQTERRSTQQQSIKLSQNKINQMKQEYLKKISILKTNQQNLRKQIINLNNKVKIVSAQNQKLSQQNSNLKQQLKEKENIILFNKEQIKNLKLKINNNITSTVTTKNKNHQQQSKLQINQVDFDLPYKLAKKQQQWSYLQFKYQKQIKSLELQLSTLKHKLQSSIGSSHLNFITNSKNDQMNDKIKQSIQFLKYHEQVLYQNMIKVKKEQDAILREWRQLDKIKKNMSNLNNNSDIFSRSQFQRKNIYY